MRVILESVGSNYLYAVVMIGYKMIIHVHMLR